jgi:hypothetical protein
MRRGFVAVALSAALVAPAGAAAKPNEGEKEAAKRECKVQRGKSKATREGFKARYGSVGRCVRQRAAEEEAENRTARKNAAKECKAEQADPDFADSHEGKSFEEFYGTNANAKNAFGKCVSSKAKAHKEAMDEEDDDHAERAKNAAKKCAAERGKLGAEAFREEYGTNHNGRNAFGKCVSAKARHPHS